MTQNEHIYAICCRLEVVGDVISGENLKTIEGYVVLNFRVASHLRVLVLGVETGTNRNVDLKFMFD